MEAASGSKAMMSCSEFSGEARPAWEKETEAGTTVPQRGPLQGPPHLGQPPPVKRHSCSACQGNSLHRPLQSLKSGLIRYRAPSQVSKHRRTAKENWVSTLGKCQVPWATGPPSSTWGLHLGSLILELRSMRRRPPKFGKLLQEGRQMVCFWL